MEAIKFANLKSNQRAIKHSIINQQYSIKHKTKIRRRLLKFEK
jgi:hypothetical protein